MITVRITTSKRFGVGDANGDVSPEADALREWILKHQNAATMGAVGDSPFSPPLSPAFVDTLATVANGWNQTYWKPAAPDDVVPQAYAFLSATGLDLDSIDTTTIMSTVPWRFVPWMSGDPPWAHVVSPNVDWAAVTKAVKAMPASPAAVDASVAQVKWPAVQFPWKQVSPPDHFRDVPWALVPWNQIAWSKVPLTTWGVVAAIGDAKKAKTSSGGMANKPQTPGKNVHLPPITAQPSSDNRAPEPDKKEGVSSNTGLIVGGLVALTAITLFVLAESGVGGGARS